jgi:hypothetical protein
MSHYIPFLAVLCKKYTTGFSKTGTSGFSAIFNYRKQAWSRAMCY